jgi:hypothetical protein
VGADYTFPTSQTLRPVPASLPRRQHPSIYAPLSMRTLLRSTVLAAVGILAGARAANPADSRLLFWYDRPAQYAEEALPVGNGRIGAMAHGRFRTELKTQLAALAPYPIGPHGRPKPRCRSRACAHLHRHRRPDLPHSGSSLKNARHSPSPIPVKLPRINSR